MPDFHVIASIEQLRRRPTVRALEARFGAAATVDALRDAAAELRGAIAGGDARYATEAAATARIEASAAARLERMFRPSLEPVINATGVVIHTNLGRAPLAAAAIERVAAVARGYSTLEYDVTRGERGRRDVHAEALLCRLTGAEAAVVVNNNAAATMILLAALAAGREVIVSRGELVEIGGGFRVPDVMAQSGAVLREVGTTNKTRAADYAAAISERTALLLRIHPSNFRIEGFTERPRLADLVTLGNKFSIPVAEDLGSGHLEVRMKSDSSRNEVGLKSDSIPMPTVQWRNRSRIEVGSKSDSNPTSIRFPSDSLGGTEPSVQDTVAAGVDVCCFSGDKLLGGPQAGIIVGSAALVDRIRRHPLMRALRVDKMTYAALEATLAEYAAGRAATTVPVRRMLTTTAIDIRIRADALAARIRATAGWHVALVNGASAVGGGSAPGIELPTTLVAIEKDALSADALEERLRQLTPPIVARIENDRVVVDLRTVDPADDERLAALVASVG